MILLFVVFVCILLLIPVIFMDFKYHKDRRAHLQSSFVHENPPPLTDPPKGKSVLFSDKD